MSKTFEHYKSVAEKEYNQMGSTYSSSVSGDVFQVGEDSYEDRYVVDTRSGRPVVFHDKTGEIVERREIIAAIKAQIEEDKKIKHARGKVAKILSDNDPTLAEILRWHLEYTGGKIKNPIQKEGVDFYQVGRNASHSFYAGVKDNNAYKMSVCYDYDHETGKDLSEEHIREVTGDWGYMGHY